MALLVLVAFLTLFTTGLLIWQWRSGLLAGADHRSWAQTQRLPAVAAVAAVRRDTYTPRSRRRAA